MGLLDSIVDTLANTEIIELYFVLSDLKDVYVTDAEMQEIAEHDSLCIKQNGYGSQRSGSHDPVTGQPWGKSVR